MLNFSVCTMWIMRISKVFTSSAIAIVASVGLVLAPLAPAWAVTYSWGLWGGEDDDGDIFPESLTFTGTGTINASVDVTPRESTSLQATETRFFTSTTPMGAVFGANGPSAVDVNNYIRLRTEDPVEVTITFVSAVPAGQLGFALSDFDNDKVTVRAWDASNNPISGEQIIGSATSDAFNYCDPAFSPLPSACTAQEPTPILVPTLEVDSDNVVVTLSTGEGEDSYIGTTAWFRPSVAVTKVTFTQEEFTSDVESNIDYWFAQTVGGGDVASDNGGDSLAKTGSEGFLFLISGFLLTFAGIAIYSGSFAARKKRS